MFLAFWPRTRWYIPGRFDHVTILDNQDDTWVQIDVSACRAEITAFWRQGDVSDRLAVLTSDCTILKYEGGERRAYCRPLTCVSFARHYSGVPSRALFPDGLMRDLLRNGAEVIHESETATGI